MFGDRRGFLWRDCCNLVLGGLLEGVEGCLWEEVVV